MTGDRRSFFLSVRQDLFSGRLMTSQVRGIEGILDSWMAGGKGGAVVTGGPAGRDALAYVLATAFHETAGTMQPVRETLAASDAEAVARLERAFAAGRLSTVKTPYWRPDAEGKSWFGRGLVQLTHRRNYETMSRLTGIDLVAEPWRAMDMDVAVTILIAGMRAGSFTGVGLADCFDGERADWLGARKIINGTDRAERVAGHALIFRAALSALH